MCGFAGFMWEEGFKRLNLDEIRCSVDKMTRAIHHRGPDSDGLISTSFARIGFKRLSIIDLDTGDQPLSNEVGNIQVFLNGEIYNHRQLRSELQAKGHRFKTQSDAEVLPHLYEEYDCSFVEHLNGMFAICLCDIEKKLICLCRDRIGIKPLYYYRTPEGLIFGSELKTILASGLMNPELDTTSLLSFIDLFYCPGPNTLVKGIKKLMPGQMLLAEPEFNVQLKKYYQFEPPVKSETSPPDLGHIDDLINDSVKLRLSADVPVGISLSGGLDSSIISMYAARVQDVDATVFTVKFENTNDQEYRCASAVAKKLGLEHIILTPSVDDFFAEFSRMVWFCDEPVADPAFYPAMKVAETASSIVKVLLSGTGGDELFAGYYHYWLNMKRRIWMKIPGSIASSKVSKLAWKMFGRADAWSSLETLRRSVFSWHCDAMSNLNINDRQTLRKHLPASRDSFAALWTCFEETCNCDQLNQQLYADSCTYLPDQLLTMLDRTTMSVSIEGRVPFLDHRLFEAMFQIAGSYKLGNGSTFKALLKTLGRDYLPREVIKRKKAGFVTPVFRWLSGDMSYVLDNILFAKDTLVAKYLPVKWIRGMCQSQESIHLNARKIYTILILQVWYELFIKRKAFISQDIPIADLFEVNCRIN